MTTPEPNLPGNSNKKKVERVTTGEAHVRKERGISAWLGGEDVQSVISYVVSDVLVPALKSAISDATSQGIERLLFGESSGRRGYGGGRTTGYTRYGGASSPYHGSTPRESNSRSVSSRARASHDFREIVHETRSDAARVLEGLENLIDQYGVATVADLYDLVGITGSYTDDKWGWVEPLRATIRPTRAGYLLDLPRPTSLD